LLSLRTVPGYIEYGGNFYPKQPYLTSNVLTYAFALRARHDSLQKIVDETLNLRSDFHYLVASPFVLMSFFKMEDLVSLHPADANKGLFRENELNVTLALIEMEKTFGVMLPRKLVWYMPYLWVDTGTPLISGREVYGFPKTLGQIEMPDALGDDASFSVQSDVVAKFGAGARVSQEMILSVRRTDAAGVESEWHTELIGELYGEIVGALEFLPFAHLWMEWVHLDDLLTLAFLKQFRDATDGSQACYQEIIEAHSIVKRFGSADLLKGDYEFDIFHFDSMTMTSDLMFDGFDPATGNVRQKALFGFRFDFDFELTTGVKK
jgi:acetoacetate decarboxylase